MTHSYYAENVTLLTCVIPEITDFIFFFDGILTAFVTIGGLFGNIIALRQIQRLKSCSVMFMSLAFVDICVMISALGFYGIPTIELFLQGYNSNAVHYLSHYLIWSTGFSTAAVSWLLVVILGTQFNVLSSPLNHESKFLSNQHVTCSVTMLVALFYSSARLFERNLVDCERIFYTGSDWNTTLSLMTIPGPLLINSEYYLAYHVGLQFIFVTGGPFVLIICYGMGIVHAVRNRPVVRQESAHAQSIRKNSAALRQDMRIARHVSRTVLLTAAKFLCSRALPLILNLTDVLNWAQDWHFAWYKPLASISNLLVISHSASNWLFYLPSPSRIQRHTIPNAEKQRASAPTVLNNLFVDEPSYDQSVQSGPCSVALVSTRYGCRAILNGSSTNSQSAGSGNKSYMMLTEKNDLVETVV